MSKTLTLFSEDNPGIDDPFIISRDSMGALSPKLIYLGAVPARKYAYCPDNLPGGLLSEVLAQKSWRSGLLVSTSVYVVLST